MSNPMICADCGEPDARVMEQAAPEGFPDELAFTGRVFHPWCWPQGFHLSQIQRKPDWTEAPDPGQDSTWWTVQLGPSDVGWVYVAASVRAPSPDWIVDELNRQCDSDGDAAVRTKLCSRRGMRLNPPR
jgi:hypothetical protein